MNTFGYNGLIQLSGSIINKQFVAQLYERNWIEVRGSVPQDDNIFPSGYPDDAAAGVKIFLRLGPPALDFQPAAIQDTTIGIFIPFQIAVFVRTNQNPDTWEHKLIQPSPLLGTIETIVLGLSPLTLLRSTDPEGITPDFGALSESSLSFYVPANASSDRPTLPEDLPYPYSAGSLYPIPDQVLEDALSAANIRITASQVKKALLDQIQAGKLPRTEINFSSADLSMPDLQQWDFRLLSAGNLTMGADGVDLLLSKSATEGCGLRENAGNTLPLPHDGAAYHFAINLSAPVTRNLLEKALDEVKRKVEQFGVTVDQLDIEIREGFIHFKIHFDRVVDYFCDIEGSIGGKISLAPNLNAKMEVKISIKPEYDLPWMVDVADFFKVGIQDAISQKIAEFTRQPFALPISNLGALEAFLEQVEVTPDGIACICYAEAGYIEDSDRQLIELPDIIYRSQPFRIAGLIFNAAYSRGYSGGPIVLSHFDLDAAPYVGKNPTSAFWSARYQDAPPESKYTEHSIEIQPGQSTMFWAKDSGGIRRKVLATWSGFFLQLVVISYRNRVHPRVNIRDHVNVIECTRGDPCYPAKPDPLVGTYLTYSGYIELETVKYYRSLVSRQSGLEHWYWDGEEIPPNASLTQPGINVEWDIPNDRLKVDINQCGLPIDSIFPVHRIEFRGEDIFGNSMEPKILILVTPVAISKLEESAPLYAKENLLHVPIPDPWRNLLDLIDTGELMTADELGFMQNQQAKVVLERLGKHPIALNALRSLSEAMEQGHADLDSRAAQVLMAALLKP